ncbi:DUF6710 family protein [Arsukibacterium perlucidum]|uniref:DUF6710 family protein n=1 Tax=Arsukibacterium perlucidum TaxID=368811 RepID=UPI000374C1E3|nr:DUF6710 family protein [Arsukibacterium perlucidum]
MLSEVSTVAGADQYLSAGHSANAQLSPWRDWGIEGPLTVVINEQVISDKDFNAWCCSDMCLIRDPAIFPQLQLSTDIVLAAPWHPRRLISNIGSIGQDRPRGIFQQDSNHMILYHYPLMIGWVAGGNHSLMQGILQGGSVIPEEVYDVSPIIHAVAFDGTQWVCCHSGNPMGKPRYPEFGWCWEIAKRIMSLEYSPYRK